MRTINLAAITSLIILAAGCSLTGERSLPDDQAASAETSRMTRETVQRYFATLKAGERWHDILADDMVFTSYTSPIKRVTGKTQYLESTKRFYASIRSFELPELLIDGTRACALTQYELQPPTQAPFISNVAEIFEVRDGRIQSFSIYFDTAPFPK